MAEEKNLHANFMTVWEWNEEELKKIEDWSREMEKKHDIEIEYVKEKQSFSVKASSYEQLDQTREEFLEMFRSIGSTAKQTFITAHRQEKNVRNPENVMTGKPPPLEEKVQPMIKEEDTEGLEGIFKFSTQSIGGVLGWNRKESFLPCDYWKDICKECKVTGYVVEDKKRIEITGGKKKDVAEALIRLKQLQSNYHRGTFYPKRIPLVHYPNQFTMFKLFFCHLFKHPYFSKTVETPFKDVYVLVSATPDPLTQKYVLPRDIPDSNLQKSLHQCDRMEQDDREGTIAKGPKSHKSASTSNDFYDSSSRDWASIPRPKDVLWSTDKLDSNSSTDFPDLSSRSDQNRKVNKGNYSGKPLPSENPPNERRRLSEDSNARKEAHKQKVVEIRNEASLIDLDDEPPVIKHSILQKNPKNATNKSTIGRMVRDYNFAKMRDVLEEGLEFVRVHKGEVRFYGSLGKVLFTKVNERVKGKLWEFTDLKDIIVSEYGVIPRFNDIATYDNNLIEGFIEVLGTNIIKASKSAYFEIKANARNAPQGDYSDVYMYVNMGFVSLEKVMLKWDQLVNIDWTVLDRKSDFSLILATRRAIRHDVKPFSTFIKKTSVSPTTRAISFEDVPEYLEVKSINFKQITKFKLHYPFVAEVSKVERLPLVDQPSSNKRIGKTGHGKVHYTIEIYNDVHRESFKQNVSLGSGEIAKWTVDDILGGNENRMALVELVKTMLLLVERCHKVAEVKSPQVENQE